MTLVENPSSVSLVLRSYQVKAYDAVVAATARGTRRRPLIALPAGTGKIIVFVELIQRRGWRGPVLVHRDRLFTEASAIITTLAANGWQRPSPVGSSQ